LNPSGIESLGHPEEIITGLPHGNWNPHFGLTAPPAAFRPITRVRSLRTFRPAHSCSMDARTGGADSLAFGEIPRQCAVSLD
jgi:hypothetical protein